MPTKATHKRAAKAKAKRKTTYMLVAANGCKDPAQKKAFDEWYHGDISAP